MALVIGLDAGHYPGDGRVARAYRSTLGTSDEYALNIKTYKAVASALMQSGFTVVDIGCKDRSVVSRAKRASSANCDLVISLHHNAGGGRGISLFRHTNGAMGTQSLRLQKCLYAQLKNVNAGNRSNPIAQAELGVVNCNYTGCPATLIECAFMDNDTDVALIKDPTYNSKLAAAITSGVRSYFGMVAEVVVNKPNYTTASNSTERSDDDMIADIWAKRTVTKSFSPYVYRTVAVSAGEHLNVRIAPDASAPSLKAWPVLSRGDGVLVVAKFDNNWAMVYIGDKYIGYVNAQYLSQ